MTDYVGMTEFRSAWTLFASRLRDSRGGCPTLSRFASHS